MFQLTKRTEYGLIALSHLASAGGKVSSAREITERYSLPQRLLAEVLKDLCKASLVRSHRGANGGYSITRTSEQISIGDVVRILEEGPLVANCEASPMEALLPLDSLAVDRAADLVGAHQVQTVGAVKSCEILSSCPIRSPIHRLHTDLWDLLDRTTLGDLTRPTSPDPLAELAQRSSTQSE